MQGIAQHEALTWIRNLVLHWSLVCVSKSNFSNCTAKYVYCIFTYPIITETILLSMPQLLINCDLMEVWKMMSQVAWKWIFKKIFGSLLVELSRIMLLGLSKMLPHPFRILRKCTTFEKFDMHPLSFSRSLSN